MYLPPIIRTQFHDGGHIQGIALDRERGVLYCAFTTELAKYDLDGHLLGTLGGLTGHLGCLSIAPDGRVFGSLEYKNDAIGQGIHARVGIASTANAFYAAIFDGARIDRIGMDATVDGIMTTVYLAAVTEDYLAEMTLSDGRTRPHRYGCSGIDGNTFAPMPGERDGLYWHVAYGIYGDTAREDNDYQVILSYNTAAWDALARPLDQAHIHTSGPAQPDARTFIYTGNTNYGVQNLEYDRDTGRMYMAVYRGKKPSFPNMPMYIADWTAQPQSTPLCGMGDGYCDEERTGQSVPLLRERPHLSFPYGATGMIALGDGYFLFSRDCRREGRYGSEITLYRRDDDKAEGFVQVKTGLEL